MRRLDSTFQALRASGESALIAYFMAGDPSLQDTENLVLQAEQGGADIIELGVPFSDPIADGPVIQRAADRAIRSGTSLRRIFEVVASLRRTTTIPLVLMAYYNSVFALGEKEFCQQAVAAGVDGLIVPDMPPEEAGSLQPAADEHGLALIFLLAPTSPARRRTLVAKQSKGFLYYVSLTGITGATLTDMTNVRENVDTIRRVSQVPIAVGFGIATPEDAGQVAGFADGVIVGSAIVKRIEEYQHASDMATQVGNFIRTLKEGMARGVRREAKKVRSQEVLKDKKLKM